MRPGELNGIGILLIILSLPFASADIITPIGSAAFIFLFPIAVITEMAAFWLLAKKLYKIKIGFWKIFSVVTVSNIVTSAFGSFINVYNDIIGPLMIYFILGVIIEFVVLLLFFAFFGKKEMVEKITLLKISFFVNLVSYVTILLVFFLSTIIGL